MVTFAHKQLMNRLAAADTAPADLASFREWIQGGAHLDLLERNTREDEIIVAALSPSPTLTCINSFVARADHPHLQGEMVALDRWSPNPLHHDAISYEWSWNLGTDGVHATKRDGSWPRELPSDVHPLVFGRSIDGVTDRHTTYYEIAQEYTHVSGIHWTPERHAYSRIDHRGDWMDVVSVSDRRGPGSMDMISFQRQRLDLHLIAMNAVLVRTFDVVLRRHPTPARYNYSEHVDRMVRRESGLYYREMVNEDRFGFIRGVQVIAPMLTPGELEQLVKVGHIGDPAEPAPVEFVVSDWRNGTVATVSTDPATTTSYFDASQNTLPYDLSFASFRSEVLAKYKADSEKYTVREDSIACRGSWYLRRYWANDAGQVCAYICDLRDLPYEEHKHWEPYNEDPQTTRLPDHVAKTDFRGQWLDEEDLPPIAVLIGLLRRWLQDGTAWWRWAADGSPDSLTVPRTESRDEWLDACLSLSTGVVEGLDLAAIRERLDEVGGEYKPTHRSIFLLQCLLRRLELIEENERVAALWDVNDLRVAKVHAAGSKARQLSDEALGAHGSYAAHFEDLCSRLVTELELIEQAFR